MRWMTLCLFSFFAFAQTSVNATQPLKGGAIDQRLSKILDGLQKTYENTSTFDAHFEQRYTYALLKKIIKVRAASLFKNLGKCVGTTVNQRQKALSYPTTVFGFINRKIIWPW